MHAAGHQRAHGLAEDRVAGHEQLRAEPADQGLVGRSGLGDDPDVPQDGRLDGEIT